MNRSAGSSIAIMHHVPRERGDEPLITGLKLGLTVMFPASAGMNRTTGQSETNSHHVPRERGDEPIPNFLSAPCEPCSEGGVSEPPDERLRLTQADPDVMNYQMP